MLVARTQTVIICLLAAQGLAACGGSRLPSGPSPAVAPIPGAPPTGNTGVSILADATLSGMVYEIANSSGTIVGIEGVAVYCEQCGASTHNWANTDSKGEYVFPPGVWTEGRPSFPVRIFVQKDGYQDPAGLPTPTPPNPSGPGWREVVVNGDTRFDIELVRR
jgi:hypothetical protein